MQRVFQRVGWSCCCWFSPLLRGVYLKALRFSPSSSKAKFHSIWNSRVRLNVVLKKRFVGKLITTTFFFLNKITNQLIQTANFVPRAISYPSLRSERERLVGERTWQRGCQTAGLKDGKYSHHIVSCLNK